MKFLKNSIFLIAVMLLQISPVHTMFRPATSALSRQVTPAATKAATTAASTAGISGFEKTIVEQKPSAFSQFMYGQATQAPQAEATQAQTTPQDAPPKTWSWWHGQGGEQGAGQQAGSQSWRKFWEAHQAPIAAATGAAGVALVGGKYVYDQQRSLTATQQQLDEARKHEMSLAGQQQQTKFTQRLDSLIKDQNDKDLAQFLIDNKGKILPTILDQALHKAVITEAKKPSARLSWPEDKQIKSKIIKSLIENGAQPVIALNWAMSTRNKELIEWLTPRMQTAMHSTVLQRAALNNDTELATKHIVLADQDAKNHALVTAASKNNEGMVDLLMQHGANNYFSALSQATGYDDYGQSSETGARIQTKLFKAADAQHRAYLAEQTKHKQAEQHRSYGEEGW